MTRGTPDLPDASACPLLGLADDPRTRFTFPHPGHRCHAGSRPSVVVPGWQATRCLSADFATCDQYRDWTAPSGGPPRSSAAGPASALPAVIHVARDGDSLALIAARYGLTVEQIVAANNLASPASVRDGQRLLIPLAQALHDDVGGTVPGAERSD